ncbi:unnamed protein product [Closterium sp. NIES-65]|nr:unnamed protein product [Closterium sp. NIES-65]
MPRFNRREQLPLHIKRAICAHHVDNPRLRHVDLAMWCYSQYRLRPDRSTVGRILKSAERWAVTAPGDNQVRRRGGAWPELEQAMARWIANAGPAGVPLTLQTIRDHVATMARNMGIPPTFRCSIGWTAHWLSVLPRRTYTNGRIPGRKLFTHFISQLDGAMYVEGRKIVVLLNNASNHMLRLELAWSEIVCGMRTTCMSNVRLVFLPPNTTAFTQPLDQGIIATAKARYRQHWLRAFLALWNADGATSAVARFRTNLRDVLAWLSEAWTSVGARTIQRCWWGTGCLPLSWSVEMTHVHDDEPTPALYPDIELDEDIDDVRTLISGLALGNAAMTAAEYVAIDNDEPTSAEGAAEQPTTKPEAGLEVELWQAPTTMQAVHDDADPVGREARRTARAACEMLIGYARATRITPCDLCHLFDIRNPIIIARMERANPSFNLNVAPQPVPSPSATPTPETPRPRGRALPGWMTRLSRRRQLLDAGVGAVMDGYCQNIIAYLFV